MIKAKLISSTKEKFEQIQNKEGIFFNSNDGVITLTSDDIFNRKVFLQTPVILNFYFKDEILIVETFNGFFAFEFLNNELPKIKLSKVAKILLN